MILPYGSIWANKGIEWYTQVYQNDIEIHDAFKIYLLNDIDSFSATEIGCGIGQYAHLFQFYTGIDINTVAIKQAVSYNRSKRFIAGDFMNMVGGAIPRYDLTFSLCTIENVPNIDNFILKCIDISNKYVYIATGVSTSDRDVQHKQELQPEGHYINTISEFQVKQLCSNYDVKLEIQHLPRKERATATIFKIEKT